MDIKVMISILKSIKLYIANISVNILTNVHISINFWKGFVLQSMLFC